MNKQTNKQNVIAPMGLQGLDVVANLPFCTLCQLSPHLLQRCAKSNALPDLWNNNGNRIEKNRKQSNNNVISEDEEDVSVEDNKEDVKEARVRIAMRKSLFVSRDLKQQPPPAAASAAGSAVAAAPIPIPSSPRIFRGSPGCKIGGRSGFCKFITR